MLTTSQGENLAKKLPIVSLHIPAYNEEFALATCLNSVQNQDCPKEWYEIILVDNNSDDGTAQVAKEFIHQHPDLNLQYLLEKKRGVQYARKAGMDLGTDHHALILAGTDADALLSPHHISNVIETLNSSRSAGFVGQRDISRDIKDAYIWYSDYWQIRNATKRLWAKYFGEEFDGNCFAITTQMYKKMNGFPIHPDWPAGEDVALSEALIKSGGSITFTDKYPVTVSDRRFRTGTQIVHSHLPVDAGGAGFPAVRDGASIVEYPPLSVEEVNKKFDSLFTSFVRRLMRRVVSQHMSEDQPMSRAAYQKMLDDLNQSIDFINKDTVVSKDNYWQLCDELYQKYKKHTSKVIRNIFEIDYPNLVSKARKYE